MLKPPPQNLEAERAALRACLMDARHIPTVRKVLRSHTNFYSDTHQHLFAAICALHDKQKPVDLLTLEAELGDKFDDVGGFVGLSTLFEGLHTDADNAAEHAALVLEASKLRRLRVTALTILDSIERGDEPQDILTVAKREVDSTVQALGGDGIQPISGVLDYLEQRYHDRDKPQAGVQKVTSGLASLDRMLGMLCGELTIIGGRPGWGKSTLARWIALHVAQHIGPVAFFSLEMMRPQLYDAFLATLAGVDLQAMRQNDLSDDDWEKVWAVAPLLASLPIHLMCSRQQTMDSIRQDCLALAGKTGRLPLIVIDYIGLLKDRRQKDERHDQLLGRISSNALVVAEEVMAHVLLLVQLNRGVEDRHPVRPFLDDLKDSSELEANAFNVLYPFRPAMYPKDFPGKEYEDRMELIIAKQRAGPIGSTWAEFTPANGQLKDIEFYNWPGRKK